MADKTIMDEVFPALNHIVEDKENLIKEVPESLKEVEEEMVRVNEYEPKTGRGKTLKETRMRELNTRLSDKRIEYKLNSMASKSRRT